MGLIPAHAGKTGSASPSRSQGWAHPRSRGENSDPAYGRALSMGSSPLTRGKQRGRRRRAGWFGLIPAHAGKTQVAQAIGVRPRAHPRSRGENRLQGHPARPLPGSSPLTRGKHEPLVYERRRSGLIPAHAGKTCLACTERSGAGAHPRSRGENVRFAAVPWAFVGSSPLTRGKLDRRGGFKGLAGLIPAHAGKTGSTRGGRVPMRAHPRSRGENSSSPSWRVVLRGSSPLTRGKRGCVPDLAPGDGLIPAHAGKTTSTA